MKNKQWSELIDQIIPSSKKKSLKFKKKKEENSGKQIRLASLKRFQSLNQADNYTGLEKKEKTPRVFLFVKKREIKDDGYGQLVEHKTFFYF